MESTEGTPNLWHFSVETQLSTHTTEQQLIESIEQRVIKGEEREYLVLRIDQGDLVVRAVDNVDLVGVRDVVNSGGLERSSVLRQPYTEEPTNWSRRYKANVEKPRRRHQGVAEVVRDLCADQTEGCPRARSACCRRRQILVSELAWPNRPTRTRPRSSLDECPAS